MTTACADIVAGNVFDKYRTTNPIYRRLTMGFIRCARDLVRRVQPARVIEIGCGPGDLAALLFPSSGGPAAASVQYVGVDISDEQIRLARCRYPRFQFQTASAYQLPFADASADLVIGCEILEHLEYPAVALSEMARVSRGYSLISVPWEPVWRMLNIARGTYLCQLGNTPGHIQHFTRAAVRGLVGRHFDIVAQRTPFPWTMLLAAHRR